MIISEVSDLVLPDFGPKATKASKTEIMKNTV